MIALIISILFKQDSDMSEYQTDSEDKNTNENPKHVEGKVDISLIMFTSWFPFMYLSVKAKILIGERFNPDKVNIVFTEQRLLAMGWTPEEISEWRRKKEIENKVSSMVREVAWNLIFLLLLALVIFGNQDDTVFHQNQHLRNTFTAMVGDR